MTTILAGRWCKGTKVRSRLSLRRFRHFQLIRGGRQLHSLFKGKRMTRFERVNATKNNLWKSTMMISRRVTCLEKEIHSVSKGTRQIYNNRWFTPDLRSTFKQTVQLLSNTKKPSKTSSNKKTSSPCLKSKKLKWASLAANNHLQTNRCTCPKQDQLQEKAHSNLTQPQQTTSFQSTIAW